MDKQTRKIVFLAAAVAIIVLGFMVVRAQGTNTINDFMCRAQENAGISPHFHIPDLDGKAYSCKK